MGTPNEFLERIRASAHDRHTETLRIRRHLHQYPELSFHESATADYIAGELSALGIDHRGGVGGGNGIVATLNPSGRITAGAVALRADFDALPVEEQNDVPFKSRNPGVMHACGHDAHTAVLLSTLAVLKSLGPDLPGTIRAVFQPAEERSPGGAAAMLEAGALADVPVCAAFGEHVNPALPAGVVGFRPGLMMAAADEIYITVRGVGGHAAQPQALVDPVTIACTAVTAVQQLVSRRAAPDVPTVLSFGRFIAEGAMNIIPNQVTLAGTFRTVDESWRLQALGLIKQMFNGICAALGATAEVNVVTGYPPLFNDPQLTERARAWATEIVGPEHVVDLPTAMWAEDFAYFSRHTAACFYNLGIANRDRNWTSPLHSPTMMIDEDALLTAVMVMSYISAREAAFHNNR